MKYEETVVLLANEPLDYKKLAEIDKVLKSRGVALGLIDLECRCLEKCQELLKQKGATYILSLNIFEDVIIPPPAADNERPWPFLVKALRDRLQSLSPARSLTIVDSYLFPPRLENSVDYLRALADVLITVADSITRINFITKPAYDSLLYEEVKELLIHLNYELVITLNVAEDFDDRFWIVDEHKGLLVGASLNGVGKKYALIDNMRDEDTRKIVEELRKRGFV